MGKKKITNKFAQTKRIISTQDQRMYLLVFIFIVNKTKRKNNNMIKKDNKH
jgi:hypothetical protein